eukprot:GHVH01002018.1.p1 GENE.GHVH01002018.1~~GHVH01002018.1.p1  ORF type:complete len:317 (+),score=45.25 GHVH01002018.1:233-1183(+)
MSQHQNLKRIIRRLRRGRGCVRLLVPRRLGLLIQFHYMRRGYHIRKEFQFRTLKLMLDTTLMFVSLVDWLIFQQRDHAFLAREKPNGTAEWNKQSDKSDAQLRMLQAKYDTREIDIRLMGSKNEFRRTESGEQHRKDLSALFDEYHAVVYAEHRDKYEKELLLLPKPKKASCGGSAHDDPNKMERDRAEEAWKSFQVESEQARNEEHAELHEKTKIAQDAHDDNLPPKMLLPFEKERIVEQVIVRPEMLDAVESKKDRKKRMKLEKKDRKKRMKLEKKRAEANARVEKKNKKNAKKAKKSGVTIPTAAVTAPVVLN